MSSGFHCRANRGQCAIDFFFHVVDVAALTDALTYAAHANLRAIPEHVLQLCAAHAIDPPDGCGRPDLRVQRRHDAHAFDLLQPGTQAVGQTDDAILHTLRADRHV